MRNPPRETTVPTDAIERRCPMGCLKPIKLSADAKAEWRKTTRRATWWHVAPNHRFVYLAARAAPHHGTAEP